ncbi:MAG: hypothetical protein HC774_00015 [Sphingomonadales bacterium]|nr:hypothetical protein [Sphingomonadales bacterium]
MALRLAPHSIAMKPDEIPLPVTSYRATMSVAPLDATHCTCTWSGLFEPRGLSDTDAVALFEGVYRSSGRSLLGLKIPRSSRSCSIPTGGCGSTGWVPG